MRCAVAVGVARGQRLHDGAVFGQGLFNAAAFEQRIVAVQLHHFAQVGHHLVAPAVVGDFQQAHVKGFVDLEEALAVADGFFQFVVQALQFLELGRRGLGGHHAGRVALQQREQVVDVGQVALRHFGHIGAAPHLHRDQAFGGQHFEGLAQRCAADAVFLGQLEFVYPAARRQFAVENALAQ
jgi:hypothetical protein